MKYLMTIFISSLLLISAGAFAVDDAVNINSASAPELEKELTGVTPAIAKRIVEYREQHGPYATVEDLLKVEGIERDILNINLNNIQVARHREDDF